MLKNCMNEIKKIQEFYVAGSSGWVLLQTAKGHLISLHYIEADTNFDEETLGVK